MNKQRLPVNLGAPDEATAEWTVSRWLPALGFAVGIFVLTASFWAQPRPGLHGVGLAILFALGGLIAGTAGLMRRGHPSARQLLPFFGILIVSATILRWLQPGGPSILGIYLAVSVAGWRLSGRQSVAVTAVALGAMAGTGFSSARLSPFVIGSNVLGGIAAYALSAMAGGC